MVTKGEVTVLARLTASEMLITELLRRLPPDDYAALKRQLLDAAPTNSVRDVDAAMSDMLADELRHWLEQAFRAADR